MRTTEGIQKHRTRPVIKDTPEKCCRENKRRARHFCMGFVHASNAAIRKIMECCTPPKPSSRQSDLRSGRSDYGRTGSQESFAFRDLWPRVSPPTPEAPQIPTSAARTHLEAAPSTDPRSCSVLTFPSFRVATRGVLRSTHVPESVALPAALVVPSLSEVPS